MIFKKVTIVRSHFRNPPRIYRRKGRIISIRGPDGKMHKVKRSKKR